MEDAYGQAAEAVFALGALLRGQRPDDAGWWAAYGSAVADVGRRLAAVAPPIEHWRTVHDAMAEVHQPGFKAGLAAVREAFEDAGDGEPDKA